MRAKMTSPYWGFVGGCSPNDGLPTPPPPMVRPGRVYAEAVYLVMCDPSMNEL